ncbi:hypothetical protein FKW77_007676 [Venturia effusa]|uniref:BTB domain-containing protein n=1 Tax=Venturia effusa TaxID=50376 RepID=A0A517LLT3_9PEZI|nr:hypothetical protein FKW77_007676 [Venturia effusa]
MADQVCKPPKKGHRPYKPLKDQNMVTISVGADFGESKEFVLPMEYLTSVSPYFEKAFEGSFREAGEKKIGLSNVEPDTFSIYVEWLHSRQIVDVDGGRFDGKKDALTEKARHMALLKLYIFADEYDNPQFRRDTLHAFTRYTNKYTECVGPDAICQAYDRLPPNSPLLRFLVDHYAYEWSPRTPDPAGTKLPIQFLYIVAIKLRAQAVDHQLPRSTKSPYLNDCDYHEHDGEKKEEK